jgi:hypothetical protein
MKQNTFSKLFMTVLSVSLFLLSGCYSKSITVEQSSGNIVEVKTRQVNSSRLKVEKGRVSTASGKLLETSKHVIRLGTWQELVCSEIVKYDTISARWFEKCSIRLGNKKKEISSNSTSQLQDDTMKFKNQ